MAASPSASALAEFGRKALLPVGLYGTMLAALGAGAAVGLPVLAPIFGLGGYALAKLQYRPASVIRAMDLATLQPDDYRHPHLRATVRQLARMLHLKAEPQLAVPREDSRISVSAGAAGDAKASVVMIAPRLLHTLGGREVTGILAHEMAHVAHGDTQVQAAADAMVVSTKLLWWGGLAGLALGAAGLLPVAPALTTVLALGAARFAASVGATAVSRGQEWRADAAAVRVTGDPVALASGLQRLHDHCLLADGMERDPELRQGLRHRLTRLFSTHPTIRARVRALTGEARIVPLPPEAPLDAVPMRALLPGLRAHGDGIPLGEEVGLPPQRPALPAVNAAAPARSFGRRRSPPGIAAAMPRP